MMANQHSKTDLRQSLLAQRRSLAADLRAQWDESIGKRLTAWLASHSIKTLGIYWPIRAEPDLRGFYAEWAARGTQLALPVVIDKNAPLKFCAWTPGETLVKDAMGMMVPPANANVLQPQALLIPCLGFNAARQRLGYGGGLYDRTLAATPRPQALGIAYDCLHVNFVGEVHDLALDHIVTESAWIG